MVDELGSELLEDDPKAKAGVRRIKLGEWPDPSSSTSASAVT